MLIVPAQRFLALVALLFLSVFSLRSQTITSVTPDSTQAGSSVTVSVTGSNTNFFSTSPSVSIVPDGGGTAIVTTSYAVLNDSLLTASFFVPLTAAIGSYGMQVANATGLVPGVFRVTPPGTIASCSPSSAPAGTSVNVTVTGSNTNFNSASPNITLTPVVGPSIFSTSFSVTSDTTLIANFAIPISATLGDYAMTVGQVTNPVPGVFAVTGAAAVGTVQGKVFHDVMLDCNQGAGEPDLSNFIVQFVPGNYYATTDQNGDYQALLPPGSYTAEVVPPMYYSRYCPSAPINISVPSAGSTSSGNDFAIEVDTVWDGSVSCGFNEFRPGFNTVIYVTVINQGILPLTGEAWIILDTNLTYVSSAPMGTLSGDTVKWSIGQPLPPGGTTVFQVTTNTPVSVQLGTPVSNESWVVSDSLDANSENDSYICADTVIGSYDPNDKTVWDQDMNLADPGIDPTDSVLIYRIRFQNTGTASAINIFIRDTLSPFLDPATLQMIGVSHVPYTMELSGTGNIEWRFPNIYLPDSTTNEPESHGYVLFKIRPRAGFSMGSSILNKASIYFDFNDPIVTNEVSTSIIVAREDPQAPLPVKVYPNPTSNTFRVEFECNGLDATSCRLFNATGTLVRELKPDCVGGLQQMEVSVSGLEAGVYFLETVVGEQQSVRKVTILR